jgi:hypothetical protein
MHAEIVRQKTTRIFSAIRANQFCCVISIIVPPILFRGAHAQDFATLVNQDMGHALHRAPSWNLDPAFVGKTKA